MDEPPWAGGLKSARRATGAGACPGRWIPAPEVRAPGDGRL